MVDYEVGMGVRRNKDMYRILKLIIPYPPPTSHPPGMCTLYIYTVYSVYIIIQYIEYPSQQLHKEQNGCIASYSLQANMGTVISSLLN